MVSRRRFLGQLAAGLALEGPLRATAANKARVALVIGNGAYASAPLDNPVADARAVAEALAAVGFDVVRATDATRAAIEDAIARTDAKLERGDAVALLYYAGHGVQVEWRNYLIPIDAQLDSPHGVVAQGVALDSILARFAQRHTRMNIVVLDACRNNPFREQASGHGLAGLDAPADTFLAYATAPGNVADDGSSGHGLYTGALLQEIGRPATRIEDVFKRVRLRVRIASEGRQIPWESSSLESDFYFVEDGIGPVATAAVDDVATGREVEVMKEAQKVNTPIAWAHYVELYPSGYFATVADFHLYQLEAPRVLPLPSPYARASIIENAVPPGELRFRVGDVYEVRRTDDYIGEAQLLRRIVTLATADRVEFNGGTFITDQLGNVIRNRDLEFDPVRCFVPTSLVPGYKWRTCFRKTEGDQHWTYAYFDLVVAARETLTVAAGRFDTARIEARGFGQKGSTEATVWIDTHSSLEIKMIFRQSHHGGQSARAERYTEELVSGPERLFGNRGSGAQ